MDLSGLHLLLTYQCTLERDHCFVWGNPRQSGTMRLEDIEHILDEARSVESVNRMHQDPTGSHSKRARMRTCGNRDAST